MIAVGYGVSWTGLLLLAGHIHMSAVSCGLGGKSVDIGWVLSHIWRWAGSKLVWMGSAGMTKLFFIDFLLTSGRPTGAYFHDGQTWQRLRLKSSLLLLLHHVFLGKPSYNTKLDLRSRQRLYCWMGEATKSHCKVYGYRGKQRIGAIFAFSLPHFST